MGTRAAFWIGMPISIRTGAGITHVPPKTLLGCVAWDGYPESFPQLRDIDSEIGYRIAVQEIAAPRDDWTPGADGFPFPWKDDLFLTNYNYFFADGQDDLHGILFCSRFYSGPVYFDTVYDWEVSGDRDERNSPFRYCENALPKGMPTGVERCPPGKGRDSIIILRLQDPA